MRQTSRAAGSAPSPPRRDTGHPILSACVELLFIEDSRAPADRIRRAAAAGLKAVEFWRWRSKDIPAIAAALEETSTELVAFSSEHEGMTTVTEQLVDPGQHDIFIAGLESSLGVAQRLKCGALVVHSGEALSGVPRTRQHSAIVAALVRASAVAHSTGVTVLLEPLNSSVDHPGHYLSSTSEGLDIIDEVNSPAVALLYDVYHSVTMGEAPSTVLAGRMNRVGHVHIADAPGRHEPGTGQIDWKQQLRWIVGSGYVGRLGLEYSPSVDSAASLNYAKELALSL